MSEADPTPEEATPATTPADAAQGSSETPYRNLWVPLVVVPAAIVMVLLVVFVFFAGIVGEEKTPRENLEVMLSGGRNARQQASFNLVRQVLEADEAEREGRDPEWDIDASLIGEVEAAWERTHESEVDKRIVLAYLLAREDRPQGLERLIELTRTPEAYDPDGAHRFNVVHLLGSLGPTLDGPERERAARALVELFESGDEGLKGLAVINLQTLPGEVAEEALHEALQDPSLEVRGNAALSLAALGDPAGEAVLLEMLDRAPYEAQRAADPSKWTRGTDVSRSRLLALETLVELGRTPSEAVLEGLSESEDLELRGRARSLLASNP